MIYNASNLFDLEIKNQSPFPLNIDYVVKDNIPGQFTGPGIYFMYYKKELVYIGSFFCSTQNNDVREQRWKKELATITMRGIQVTMNDASNIALDRSYNLSQIDRRPKGDFLTSKNRVEFADSNWDEFKHLRFLSDFTFYWFREDKNLNRTKKHLERVTKELRDFYKPTCNG
jgi:hypothetical protein